MTMPTTVDVTPRVPAGRPVAALLGLLAALPLALSVMYPILPWMFVWMTPFVAAGIARWAFGVSAFAGFGAGAAAAFLAWAALIRAGAVGLLIPLCAYADSSYYWKPGLVAAVAYLIAAAIGGATRKWWAWTAAAIVLAVAYGLAVAAIVPPGAPGNC